jgi:Na+/proline symporter
MALSTLDWLVIAAYALVAVVVGVLFTHRAGHSTDEFFLSGRKLPWWLLGISLVATTFSTDTPNLVTDLVRTGGVSQNWVWWAFLLTGLSTVFFYARLWRRSGLTTDVGFYELRYAGAPARFLRAFRAVYLGVFFNIMIMASVTLAATKIAGVLLSVDKYTTVLVAAVITAIYSATSGLWGVVVTDVIQFVIAMGGSLVAAYYALSQPEVGGLSGLLSHEAVAPRLGLLPDFSDSSAVFAVLVIPLAVQWWSTWYPGSEPGGGGYVAQRMLAARNEREAIRATLLFNLAHYALRPWPWILVALASLVVYPDLASIAERFPNLDRSIIGHDLAYPAMLVLLPSGVLGLVVASLAAAYMSTISTHLNWGASYVVDDVYRRFLSPGRADTHYVTVARIVTLALSAGASLVSLWLEHALQAFQILLQIGAGTGLLFLLRWFWWRINAWSELAAMVISFAVAVYFQFVHAALGFAPWAPGLQLVVGVAVTTTGWVTVTFLTPPTQAEVLQRFYDRIRPYDWGWRSAVRVDPAPAATDVSAALGCWFFGCVAVYSALFGTGYALYGSTVIAVVCLALCVAAMGALFGLLPRVRVVG